MTPLLVTGLQRRGLDPKPFVIALAAAANAGSAATIIGNPQNILIGQVGGLDFWPFLAACGPPALVGLLCVQLVIAWLWRGRLAAHRHGSSRTGCGPARPLDPKGLRKAVFYTVLLLTLFATPLPHVEGVLLVAGRAPGQPQPRHAAHAGPGRLAPAGAVRGLFVVTARARRARACRRRSLAAPDAGTAWRRTDPIAARAAHPRGRATRSATCRWSCCCCPCCRHPRRRRSTASPCSRPWPATCWWSAASPTSSPSSARATCGVQLGFLEHARCGIPITVLSLTAAIGWLWLIGS